MLAKTLGLKYLVVIVNKMDDPTVEWSKDRWDEILRELSPYIKSVGYNLERDVFFIPISGLKGTGMKDRVPKEICPWNTYVLPLITFNSFFISFFFIYLIFYLFFSSIFFFSNFYFIIYFCFIIFIFIYYFLLFTILLFYYNLFLIYFLKCFTFVFLIFLNKIYS